MYIILLAFYISVLEAFDSDLSSRMSLYKSFCSIALFALTMQSVIAGPAQQTNIEKRDDYVHGLQIAPDSGVPPHDPPVARDIEKREDYVYGLQIAADD